VQHAYVHACMRTRCWHAKPRVQPSSQAGGALRGELWRPQVLNTFQVERLAGAVSQATARRMDGALMAFGTMSNVLHKKVGPLHWPVLSASGVGGCGFQSPHDHRGLPCLHSGVCMRVVP
jgi:hypothetical protein